MSKKNLRMGAQMGPAEFKVRIKPTELKVPQDGGIHLQGTSDCRRHRIVTGEVSQSPKPSTTLRRPRNGQRQKTAADGRRRR